MNFFFLCVQRYDNRHTHTRDIANTRTLRRMKEKEAKERLPIDTQTHTSVG